MENSEEMGTISFDEFVKSVDSISNYFNWRYGQALMNVLHGTWPEKYAEITESEYDPYYYEDNVPKVLELLKENWNPTNDKL